MMLWFITESSGQILRLSKNITEVYQWKNYKKTEAILLECFGCDSVIALSTAVDNKPYVRFVNAFYEDGAFYVLTHALSGKMKQTEKNPVVAISGE